MISTITSWLSSAVKWTHESIKEIPVAGHAYNVLNENISTPLWNLGCKGRDLATPFFSSFRASAEPTIRRNTLVVSAASTGMVFAVGRVVYLYFFPRR